jgi:hypothetical protein
MHRQIFTRTDYLRNKLHKLLSNKNIFFIFIEKTKTH